MSKRRSSEEKADIVMKLFAINMSVAELCSKHNRR